MARQWVGKLPNSCDLCWCLLMGQGFVDGRTKQGPWAIMCLTCFGSHGVGLGVGRGQAYEGEQGVRYEDLEK